MNTVRNLLCLHFIIALVVCAHIFTSSSLASVSTGSCNKNGRGYEYTFDF